jgi:hypothetical protein
MKVKRQLPPILKAWGECRRATGILPGKKMSTKQYAEAKSCVAKRMKTAEGKKAKVAGK